LDIIDTSQCLNCEVLHGRSTRLDFTSEEIAEGYFLDAMRPWPCTTLSRNSNCCKLEEVIQETSRQGWGRTVSEIRALTPYESDRKKWSSLLGVNLVDGESYQIAVQPTINQDKVIPDSFRILLRKYLGKPESKSLAPDGTPCTGATRGILQRTRITAGKFVPVGKGCPGPHDVVPGHIAFRS